MTRAILAIDQGTTGSTCLVVTEDGRIIGRGYREITQYFPEPGRVEHDAGEIFQRTRAERLFAVLAANAFGLRQFREQAKIDIHGLKAVGVGAAGNMGQKRAKGRGGRRWFKHDPLQLRPHLRRRRPGISSLLKNPLMKQRREGWRQAYV